MFKIAILIACAISLAATFLSTAQDGEAAPATGGPLGDCILQPVNIGGIFTLVLDCDQDDDGVENAIDNCDSVPNLDQANHDADPFGDACDTDWDNDGVSNASDACPFAAPQGALDADANGCTDTIAGLRTIVAGMNVKPLIKGGGLLLLDSADASHRAGNVPLAEAKLRLFVFGAQVLRGKGLTAVQVELLTSYADNIIANI
jgi:hypothetical protein